MSPLYQLTSLEAWLEKPPPHTEWLQGVLVEKSGMTLKHSQIQAKLANKWIIFLETHQLGGLVYRKIGFKTPSF
jgi:Uma2 family endonuclease